MEEGSRRVLKELGLTGYESSVYLSLVRGGVLTASEVSERAGIPFSKVYEVLNSLEQKGWIDVERGRPARYFAKSPVEAFTIAQGRIEEKVRRWERVITSELQPLYEKRELREKPDIWILRGKKSVLMKLKEMLSEARIRVMIAIPSFADEIVEDAIPLVGELRWDDVDVQVMVTKELKSQVYGLMSGVEVRGRDSMFGGGVIVDGKEALLLLGEEEKTSLVVWSNHTGLVKFAEDYFKYLWNSSS
jgi:sugar-specific transcriptional regulator TrmB